MRAETGSGLSRVKYQTFTPVRAPGRAIRRALAVLCCASVSFGVERIPAARDYRKRFSPAASGQPSRVPHGLWPQIFVDSPHSKPAFCAWLAVCVVYSVVTVVTAVGVGEPASLAV
ncbi:hypothetical protein AGIG_G3090 [Arapaima gigas]